jgi:hypothetical protein
MSVTVSKGVTVSVSLNKDLRGYLPELNDLGVDVMASDEIMVYVLNSNDQSADAFLAYPVDVLGREYHVMCRAPDCINLICAVEDATTVSFINPLF